MEETKEEKDAREKSAFKFGLTVFLSGLFAPIAIAVGLFCIVVSFISKLDD